MKCNRRINPSVVPVTVSWEKEGSGAWMAHNSRVWAGLGAEGRKDTGRHSPGGLVSVGPSVTDLSVPFLTGHNVVSHFHVQYSSFVFHLTLFGIRKGGEYLCTVELLKGCN